MDASHFDHLARHLAGSTSRRGTLIGLVGGLLAPLVSGGETEAKGSLALHIEKKKRKRKKKKRCTGGTTRCGKRCVDTRSDPANRGGCGRACAAPSTCGGGNPGTPGECGCTKAICAAGQCGNPSDGCGGTLSCGECEDPENCGGGRTPNVCGCLADGAVTSTDNREACCRGSCCFDGVPGQCVCAGGCG